jgi:rare lipoprotein A
MSGNPKSNQTSEVRVNNRGPFVKGRIIDLSHSAVNAIGIHDMANVRSQVISLPSTRGVDLFSVQIGAFSTEPEARQLRADVEREYGTARLVFSAGHQTWRVLVGLQPTMQGATLLAQQTGKKGAPAFAVRNESEQ